MFRVLPSPCLIACLSLLAAYAPWGNAELHAQSKRKPNIILIVADDLGYADIGVHGCKDIPTPHIDSIAKNGIRCTSGYVSGPYCSPTRAGLLTGRYQQRFGHEFNPGPPVDANKEKGLSLQEMTLAQFLRGLGYRTGMVGKWHLGHTPEFLPTARGFEEYFGFLGGANQYIGKRGNQPIYRGTKPVEEDEYLTDAFAREALAYIDKHKKEPFFLYLTFNAVHAPMQASEKYLKRFGSIQDETRRKYAAMLSAMDDAIGQVLAKLRETGIEDDTLIFFISDNGGPPVNASSNLPLRGWKASTWEGGVRVPFLVQWKGTLPAGKLYDEPVIQLDILPTVLAATGGKTSIINKIDGVDLLPYLSGKKAGAPHEALYWRFGAQMAIRMGDWKLVKARDPDTKGGLKKGELKLEGAQLFNLKDDIGETKDLSKKHPDKMKELTAAWQRWNEELAPPAWAAPAAAKNKDKKPQQH
ncbi:MAG: sulfatase [Gemmataceae bacterium]|nr:sulfatase [Gemmataceae bacterium]